MSEDTLAAIERAALDGARRALELEMATVREQVAGRELEVIVAGARYAVRVTARRAAADTLTPEQMTADERRRFGQLVALLRDDAALTEGWSGQIAQARRRLAEAPPPGTVAEQDAADRRRRDLAFREAIVAALREGETP